MSDLNQLQRYHSTSPRCFYGNNLISLPEPCFLSPPGVSLSCWDSLRAENPTVAGCRCRQAIRADVGSRPSSSAGLNPTVLARLKVLPSGTPTRSSPGCCCREGMWQRVQELGGVLVFKVNLKPCRSCVGLLCVTPHLSSSHSEYHGVSPAVTLKFAGSGFLEDLAAIHGVPVQGAVETHSPHEMLVL